MQNHHTLQRRARQKGAFGILAASAMSLALGCLVLVVDGGRLYMEQRRLQKIADTAALESVARLPQGSCSMDPALALQIAKESAQRNNFLQDARQDIEANCVNVRSMDGLRVAVPRVGQEPAASVEVAASHTVPASIILRTASLFSSEVREEVTLTAKATAERETPSAVFAVGSQLLRLDNSKLLGQLLGAVGLDVQKLTLLDRNGLADASITPSGLLNALGIKIGIERLRALSPQGLIDLVNTEVGLLGVDRLLAVSAELVSDSVLRAQIELLGQEILKNPLIGDINLFAGEGAPGLLSISSAPDGTVGSALDARINLEQILTTSLMIGVASEGRALKLDGLDLLGIITVKLGIVEPPSIGIGPIGTTAYNAQVRLLVDVDTNRNSSSLLGAGSLLELLGTRIKLPIIVELVDAKGTLKAVNCSVAPPTATIDVESRIGSACIGRMPEETLWSKRQSCTEVVQDERLIRLLGINLLYGKVALPVLSKFDEVTLSPPPSENNIASTGVNNLQIGTLVSRLLDELLTLLANSPILKQKQFTEEQAGEIATEILSSQDLLPTGTNGTYTNSNLDRIRTRMENLGLEWNRPGGLLGLFSTTMPVEWRYSVGGSCNTDSCVRSKLIASLQTPERDGLLSSLLTGLLGGLLGGLQPLLAAVLGPVVALLEPILNAVGTLLTTLLADILGVELGRTDVELYSVGCGTPKLVR
ncbi:pilus assembly protein TadG-related protein [Pseudomonas sp. NW5]|uniref:pilus assembly protein TadG-related protein n=1 Tax=Pseudomonas sp. NW5 TaxID=2934934 RepID=UPI00202004D2|nr:pilus assembly protein TadG-related protein [Pseudomonas sp. NW5]MCL7462309.1 pilus assembly protein TadG-related protein [Pseudomonas sp. NW5]